MRASMIVAFRDWMHACDADVITPAPWLDRGLRVRFRRIRADATNADIYHKALRPKP